MSDRFCWHLGEERTTLFADTVANLNRAQDLVEMGLAGNTRGDFDMASGDALIGIALMEAYEEKGGDFGIALWNLDRAGASECEIHATLSTRAVRNDEGVAVGIRNRLAVSITPDNDTEETVIEKSDDLPLDCSGAAYAESLAKVCAPIVLDLDLEAAEKGGYAAALDAVVEERKSRPAM